MCTHRPCIGSVKHFLTNLTRLVSRMQTTKNFSNIAMFDFESICVEVEDFEDTEPTTRIGKQDPVSVSTLSNLIQGAIFLCNPNHRDLVSSFIDALQNLATQRTAQMKMKILQNEATLKSRLVRIRVFYDHQVNVTVTALVLKQKTIIPKTAEDNFYKCRRINIAETFGR